MAPQIVGRARPRWPATSLHLGGFELDLRWRLPGIVGVAPSAARARRPPLHPRPDAPRALFEPDKNKPVLTPLPRSDPAPPWRICCAHIPLGPSHLTRPLVTSRLVMAPAALCEFPPDPFQVLGRREAGPTVRSSIPPVHIPLPPRAYPLRLALLTPHLRPD